MSRFPKFIAVSDEEVEGVSGFENVGAARSFAFDEIKQADSTQFQCAVYQLVTSFRFGGVVEDKVQ